MLAPIFYPYHKQQLLPSVTAIVCLLIVLGLGACKPQAAPPPPGAGMPPSEVSVVTVVPTTTPVTFEYPAQTVGFKEVEVRARATGILLRRNYQEGSEVQKGQSLFTIDPAPMQATLARTQAELAAGQARLAQSVRDAERLKPLIEARAVSQKEYDDATSAKNIAEAEIKAIQARLAEARLNLGYTRVEAPISGLAGRALQSEGSLISGPDVLLTTVSQVDPMYVLFNISDNDQLKLRSEIEAGRLVLPANSQVGVTLKFADGSQFTNSGKLNFSDIRVNQSTGTSEVRAELANPKGVLRPGQFVRAKLSGATRPNAILVPQRAVLEGPQGKYVYIVNAESKVEPRPVEVGEWLADQWLINSGLRAGDRVVTDGVLKIGPGAPVKIAAPAATPGTSTKPNNTATAH